MIDIGALRPDDRPGWEVLARAYKDFYRTPTSPQEYEAAWGRLVRGDGVHGVAARVDGLVVGIAHYLFHTDPWSTGSCYLQDLYVDEAVRGRGVARELIEHVAGETRARGLRRLYWHTKQDNTTARALYDKVARFHGFITYQYPVG